MKNVCIYHFTDGSEKRPKICQKQVDSLHEFAGQFGEVSRLYLDKSLRKREQSEKENMMQEIEQYDVLVTKDFYHICKNTNRCIQMLQQFSEAGVETASIEDGSFHFYDPPFDANLRVCLYHSRLEADEDREITTQIEIFKLFISSKTDWKITGTYIDNLKSPRDAEQKQLMEMIKHRDEYDLVLCKDFNRIHWRTAKFCQRRRLIGRDIYSLRVGYLKYEMEEQTC